MIVAQMFSKKTRMDPRSSELKAFFRGSGYTIFGVILIVLIWTIVFVKYFENVRSDSKEAGRTNENIAMFLEENVLRTIGEIDKSVLYIRRSIETHKETTDYQSIINTTDVLSETIVQVAVIDAHGIMRASNAGPQPAAPIDLSDREHFQVHRKSAEDRLFISKPLIGRASGKLSVQFTRRFLNKDGSFGGVVVASLNPSHLTNFYNRIKFASSVSVVLIGADGIVRSSGGNNDSFQVGEDVTGTGLLDRASATDPVTVEETNFASDEKYVVTVRPIRGLPLWVCVQTDLKSIYGNAAFNIALNGAIGLTFTLVIMIVITYAKEYEANSEKRAQLLHLTLENMTQGIMFVTKDLEIPIINARCVELLNLPPEFVEYPPRFDTLVANQAGALAGLSPQKADDQIVCDQNPANTQFCEFWEQKMVDGTILEVRSTPLPGGGFVRTFTDVTKRLEAEHRIARLASEDALTGLANRRVFRQAIEQIWQHRTSRDEHDEIISFAVMFLDLDRFKVINDALGHEFGDRLIKDVGNKLKSVTQSASIPNILVARLGGDEFAVLVPMAISRSELCTLADHMIEAISKPFDVHGHQVRTATSIGIAIFPDDGRTVDDLLISADLALYAAKAEKRGCYKFHDQAMSAKLNNRREIELDLRAALERNELELHYQPIIDLKTNRVAGFEALARWRHPAKGLIPPALFIPVAEDSGLIMPIGSWALAEACRQATEWPLDLKIAVNLSPIQLLIPDLAGKVAGILAETGLAAHRLEIEITEQIVLDNNEATIAILRQLKEIGIRIVMDDFGTGYSSLSYLRMFPFDKIKIDRSFVVDLAHGTERAAIIQAVVSIARALSMSITAEGVEAEYQFEFLKALGCDEAQGFLFSRAVPAEEVAGIIAEWEIKKNIAA